MLYDDQCIAQISQLAERLQQTPIVPLMEADARLVQDVDDAFQAGADLRRQPDALCLAAG